MSKCKLVCPCDTCPDDKNGRREAGVCNHGFGICKDCLDYWAARREATAACNGKESQRGM